MSEYPAMIKHTGLPPRPTQVRRVDRQLTWRVVETLAEDRDVEYGGVAAECVYRLQVFGPLPRQPHRDGTFDLVAVNYRYRPYWWVALPAER